MKVNFLIAGVQKGGTTSLDAYLRQHPQIGMAQTKETHFFDNEAEFSGGIVSYESYHRFFRERDAVRCYGEATPIYTYWPPAMSRIRQYNPQMKIIVLLRNPIERAWSGWRMERRRGAETLPFSAAIRLEPERTRSEGPQRHRVFSYLDRGRYAEQIRRTRAHFPESALFLKSEFLFSRTGEAVSRVLRFLDVAPHPIDTSTIHFQGETGPAPPIEDREFLLARLRGDIEETERLLGWDCRDWLRL